MGRLSTGAYTTIECKRIELSFLLKEKFLQKGKIIPSKLSWDRRGKSTGNITIISRWLEKEKSIQLIYTLTDRNGDSFDYDYKIYLEGIPSNLGKGEVLYFLCPGTGERCRILYSAYLSHKWYSRKYFEQKGLRIYYQCQHSSKLNHPNDRYWELKRRLEKMLTQRKRTPFFNGKETRWAKQIQKLEREVEYWDRERWKIEYMPLLMRKAGIGISEI